MPWDGTELMLADVGEDGTFGAARHCRRRSRRVGRPGRMGRRRHAAVRHATAPAGGICTGADPDAGPVHCAPARRSSPGRSGRSGQAGSQPLANGLIAVVHGTGATALGVLDPETGELVDAPGPGPSGPPTSPSHGTPGRRGRRRGRTAPTRSSSWTPAPARTRVIGAAAPRHRATPRYYPEPWPAPSPGPDGREIHAHIYPPRNPGLHGARRASCRPTWCGRTAGPPAGRRSYSTWRSPTSPPAASASPRSTTADRPATAGRTATGCASSGASSTSRTAPPSPWRSPPRAPPTPPGSRSAAAARAAGPPRPR